MKILDSIKSLFSDPNGLVCPRCERSLEGHDEAECSRKMSRRYFFGTVAGGVIVAATAKPLLESGIAIQRALIEDDSLLRKVNDMTSFTSMITNEMLECLRNNMVGAHLINQKYDKLFRHYKPLGDTIQVREPQFARVA